MIFSRHVGKTRELPGERRFAYTTVGASTSFSATDVASNAEIPGFPRTWPKSSHLMLLPGREGAWLEQPRTLEACS